MLHAYAVRGAAIPDPAKHEALKMRASESSKILRDFRGLLLLELPRPCPGVAGSVGGGNAARALGGLRGMDGLPLLMGLQAVDGGPEEIQRLMAQARANLTSVAS